MCVCVYTNMNTHRLVLGGGWRVVGKVDVDAGARAHAYQLPFHVIKPLTRRRLPLLLRSHEERQARRTESVIYY